MTEENLRHERVRLAILSPGRYAREAVRPGPALGEILGGPGDRPAPEADTEPAAPADPMPPGPEGQQPRRPNGQFGDCPLYELGARIRRRGHARHAAATTPGGEMSALIDYWRMADAAALRHQMYDHAAEDAAVQAALEAGADAIGVLRAAADTLTSAMQTWRPAP